MATLVNTLAAGLCTPSTSPVGVPSRRACPPGVYSLTPAPGLLGQAGILGASAPATLAAFARRLAVFTALFAASTGAAESVATLGSRWTGAWQSIVSPPMLKPLR